MTNSSIVLDASAVLAFLHREPGHQVVSRHLAAGSALSTVNLAEVAYKLSTIGLGQEQLQSFIALMDIETFELTADQAYLIARMKPAAKKLGLSLADLACMALGKHLGLPVLTADRIWKQTEFDIEVILIR